MNKKIILRPITTDDTENIIRWRNNPVVRSNFIDQRLFTKEKHLQWLKTQVNTGKVSQFIIVDAVSQQDIGSVYLRDINRTSGEAEFGIFIGEDNARGKGFGQMAAKQILDYGFLALNLQCIFLRVFADNLLAINSYKKAGFKENNRQETVNINGKPQKIIFMEINK